LEKDRFISSGLTELEEISVNDCEIERVNLRAFSGLRKLALLSICGNKLREITPDTFDI
jgi:Leucine-rich repeat (LRR) protein